MIIFLDPGWENIKYEEIRPPTYQSFSCVYRNLGGFGVCGRKNRCFRQHYPSKVFCATNWQKPGGYSGDGSTRSKSG
jgi:hypothetical protein